MDTKKKKVGTLHELLFKGLKDTCIIFLEHLNFGNHRKIKIQVSCLKISDNELKTQYVHAETVHQEVVVLQDNVVGKNLQSIRRTQEACLRKVDKDVSKPIDVFSECMF